MGILSNSPLSRRREGRCVVCPPFNEIARKRSNAQEAREGNESRKKEKQNQKKWEKKVQKRNRRKEE